MNYIISAITLVILVHSCSGTSEDEEKWVVYKRTFSKTYPSTEEDTKRKEIFLRNMKAIGEHNAHNPAGGRVARLRENEYTDMEPRETSNPTIMQAAKSKRHLGNTYYRTREFDRYPKEVDWRHEGVVGPVTSQGKCSSCWAHAALGAIESAAAIISKIVQPLSKQQLVDCAGSEGAYGCQGGSFQEAFEYIIKAGGVMIESDYPYEGRDGSCRFNESKAHATIGSYKQLAADEQTLQEVVAYEGPVAASINTEDFAWRFHDGQGVYDNPNCSKMVDHGVLIVGYGTHSGTDYWLVKNSFGTKFGDNGYIKMARNKDNQCGIATWAYKPLDIRVNLDPRIT